MIITVLQTSANLSLFCCSCYFAVILRSLGQSYGNIQCNDSFYDRSLLRDIAVNTKQFDIDPIQDLVKS